MKKVVDLIVYRSLYDGYMRKYGSEPKELLRLLFQAGLNPEEEKKALSCDDKITLRFTMEINRSGTIGVCAYCGVELKEWEDTYCNGCKQLMELAAMYSDGGGI